MAGESKKTKGSDPPCGSASGARSDDHEELRHHPNILLVGKYLTLLSTSTIAPARAQLVRGPLGLCQDDGKSEGILKLALVGLNRMHAGA